MCDGIGGARVALGRRTIAVKCHSVEKCRHLREFIVGMYPGTTAEEDACDMDLPSLLKPIQKESWDMILLVAGPPCQPFSGLSGRATGFEDPRSHPLLAFKEVRGRILSDVCPRDVQEVRWLVEEVASMSATDREAISSLLGAQPVLLNAAD